MRYAVPPRRRMRAGVLSGLVVAALLVGAAPAHAAQGDAEDLRRRSDRQRRLAQGNLTRGLAFLISGIVALGAGVGGLAWALSQPGTCEVDACGAFGTLTGLGVGLIGVSIPFLLRATKQRRRAVRLEGQITGRREAWDPFVVGWLAGRAGPGHRGALTWRWRLSFR